MLKLSQIPSLPESEEYFNRLRRPLRVGLLTAFIVPLFILSLYFHFQFNFTLKKSGKLHLTNLAESQRNTIDLFLQERVINIFNLFYAGDFTTSPSKGAMESYLNRLRKTSDAFVDVGFLDEGGIQSGYAGPYHHLQGRDYSREAWFEILMDRDQDYYISDIYLGFRRTPHFTIAVKQRFDDRCYIMRATLDPDKFYMFLRTLGDGKGGDSALINKEGKYQLVNPDHGELLDSCDFVPANLTGSGADEIETSKGSALVAYAWLNEAPWSLVVQQPLEIAYMEMYRARWILFSSSSVEEIVEELGYIDEAVIRAKIITQKLLVLARRTEPNLAPCNVNKILDEVVGGLKEQEFMVSNIELVREFDAKLPDVVVDPDQVRQVFLNILNNAGDAIEGSGTITLSTACDGEFVRVTITDTGKGMTSDQIDRIFFPFFTTKEVGKGTGLGLSISLSIVEAMGGRIEVQSMPDKGSAFTVVLPVDQEEVTPNV